MKVLITISCMVLAVTLTSCGDNDSSSNRSSDSSFSVKIDGVDYNPEFVSAFITTFETNILITGSEANGRNVTLNFPITATAGSTYTVEGLEFVASYDTSDDDASFANSEGSITITAHNTSERTASGTFNFVTQPIVDGVGNTYAFTEGTFEVVYVPLN